MKNILTIFKREINAYFNSSIAYIFLIVFLLLSVGLFMSQFFIVSVAGMRNFFDILPLILCIFLSAITMRLWAEDMKGNTLELLLTFPVKTSELVLGKFLAGFVFYCLALAATLTVPVTISFLGTPDVGIIITQYFGALLLGAFFLALGIFISGFCRDQIVSFIAAMTVCFGFYLLGIDLAAAYIDGWIPGFGTFLHNALGLAGHLGSFAKGIIDLRDVFYFLIGASIFLLLNGFWFEIRFRPRMRVIFAAAVFFSLGIFVVFNLLLADMPIGRFDLTADKAYMISPASEKILRALQAPVTAKLFISPPDKMPSSMKMLERDIKDKLDELSLVSGGKFKYMIFHMEAAVPTAGTGERKEDSLEKSVEKKGIMPFQVQSIEADELGVKLVYSAMSFSYKEKEDVVIPIIVPQDFSDLEYLIISKVYKMTLDKAPTLALVAPYTEKKLDDPQAIAMLKKLGRPVPEYYREDDYEMLENILKFEGYRVVRIRLTQKEPIPPATDTLILLEPRALGERQKFEIVKFLSGGGSLFLAVQQHEFQYKPLGRSGVGVTSFGLDSGVNIILEKWGLGVSTAFLMDEEMEVISIALPNAAGSFAKHLPLKLPIQIRVISDQMNKGVVMTAHLPTIFYFWGTALELYPERLKTLKLKNHVLFSSSKRAWERSYHEGDLRPNDLFAPSGDVYKKFPLAVYVKGQFPNFYENKRIPDWPSDQQKGGVSYGKILQKRDILLKSGKLVLVGCADMFRNNLINKGGQSAFFMNAIDTLTLGDELVSIRNKKSINRSLKKVSTAAKAGWKIFNILFVPLLLCVMGGLRIFLRRRSKRIYLKTLEE